MYTTLSILKHLQYKATDEIIKLITATGVPTVKNILTFKGTRNYKGMS